MLKISWKNYTMPTVMHIVEGEPMLCTCSYAVHLLALCGHSGFSFSAYKILLVLVQAKRT